MITAVIQNGRQTAAIELPQDWCSLQYWLAQMDIREQPEHKPCRMRESASPHTA